MFGLFVGKGSGGIGCSADLGSANAAGNNVYNRTSQKNGVLGLCFLSTVAATASSSTWSCGLAANAACTPAANPNPAPVVSPACDQPGDYNQSAQLTVALPQTCCGL